MNDLNMLLSCFREKMPAQRVPTIRVSLPCVVSSKFLVFVKLLPRSNFKVRELLLVATAIAVAASFFEASISRKEIPLWGLSRPRKNPTADGQIESN